ncbi:MAG: FecR domain-containing protein [Polyangiaceae bacterium]
MTEQQVANSFRELANEHAREREPFDKRRAWQFVQQVLRAPIHAPQVSVWPARFRWAAALGALAALTLTLVFGIRAWQNWSSLRYEARGLLREGNTLSAQQQPAALDFSDGSRVTASPLSTFNLDVVGRRAALTRLLKGQLHVSVHHEPDTNWHFFAGPYEVQVVGTEFDLGWDAEAGGLTLVMQSGEVRVLGDSRIHRVLGGQTLHLPLLPAPTAPSAPALAVVSPPAELAHAPIAAFANAPPAPAAHSNAGVQHAPSSDWSAWLDQGRFADVVQAADTLGLDNALAAAGARDLKALALAARYTGRRTLSLRAWNALRERFPGPAVSVGAAFFLGRGYEEQGDLSGALRWLGRYLAETPSGVYAGEALGRKLLLLDKSGDHAAALSSAREYLSRYPRGAYAKSAQAIAQPE